MKKKIILLLIYIPLHYLAIAQTATDVTCQQNVFYGNVGNIVHALQLNANSVTDLGAVTTTLQTTLNSLAMGNDITQGSSNRTFYSSTSSGLLPCAIVRYTGAVWDTITTDTIIYHNGGAYGPFIYFQCSPNAPPLTNQCIARLDASGNLTKIFTDTTLRFTVADMAIDTMGNIYCFRGPSIGNTTEITVLDPNGNIINSYATNLNNLTTLFGCMFLNGTLYLGHSTTNSSLFPVNFSGSTATLGTAIPMNISMKDLANCYSTVDNTVGLSENSNAAPGFTVSMKGNLLHVNYVAGSSYNVLMYDMQGRLVLEKVLSNEGMIDMGGYDNGVYLVRVVSGERVLGVKMVLSIGY